MINPLFLAGGEVTPPEPPYIIERSNQQGGGFRLLARTENNTESCYAIWEQDSVPGATVGTIAFWIKPESNGLTVSGASLRTILSCDNPPDALAQKSYLYSAGARGDISGVGIRNDSYYFTADNINLLPIAVNTVSNNGCMHWVIAYDTTQAVADDRIKFYVNGVQAFAGNMSSVPQNLVMGYFQTNYRLGFSYEQAPSADPGPSYVADVYAIAGTAYGPEKFGKFSNGVWVPIAWPDAIPTEAGTFFMDYKQTSPLNPDWVAAAGAVAVNDFGSSLGNGNFIGELSGEDTNFGYRAFNGNLGSNQYSISNDVSPGGTLTWTTSRVGPNDEVEWLVGPAGSNAAAAGETGSISGTNLTTINLVSNGVINSNQWYTIRPANTVVVTCLGCGPSE